MKTQQPLAHNYFFHEPFLATTSTLIQSSFIPFCLDVHHTYIPLSCSWDIALPWPQYCDTLHIVLSRICRSPNISAYPAYCNICHTSLHTFLLYIHISLHISTHIVIVDNLHTSLHIAIVCNTLHISLHTWLLYILLWPRYWLPARSAPPSFSAPSQTTNNTNGKCVGQYAHDDDDDEDDDGDNDKSD